ncbi:MAG: S-layer homology domain-containing protein [Deltaproteobacteria bacterium]|nr:S-layer homology domain-containing protein [Deltaproteobacteria bacterium]
MRYGKFQKKRLIIIKKYCTLFLIAFVFAISALFASNDPFADINKEHWAYDAVTQLAAKGIVKGYANGSFKGEKPLTRYEMAMVLGKLLENLPDNKARLNTSDFKTIERLTVEFSEELSLLGVKVQALEEELKGIREDLSEVKNDIKEVENIKKSTRDTVNINGEVWMQLQRVARSFDSIGDDWLHEAGLSLSFFMNIDSMISAFLKVKNEEIDLGNLGNSSDGTIDELYIDIKDFYSLFDMRVGRQRVTLGHGIVLDDKVDGLTFTKILDRIKIQFFAFSTRKSRPDVNNQLYGDASGSKPFWLYDDTYELSNKANSSFTGDRANYIANGGYTPGSYVTLYSAPYSWPMPWDEVTGNQISPVPNHRYNGHYGIALTDNTGRLLPTDCIAPGTLAPVTLMNGNYPPSGKDSEGREIQANTASIGSNYINAAYRDWQMETRNGLDSIGMNFGVDIGGHNIAAYFMMRRYDKFDPYTVLGDPYACMVDADNDNVLDFSNGAAVSPRANPTYWGISMNGDIFQNLKYFFEYTILDPDVANIGVNPLTGSAKNNSGTWNGNNLNHGSAWIAGINWDVNDKFNFLAHYGEGDEEFVGASIYRDYSLNGMEGRLNPDDPSLDLPGDYDEGTNTLTGVTDLLVKMTADFTDRTRGIFGFEACRDNDTSPQRLIAGDPLIVGHAKLDYNLISAKFEHMYSPNTSLALEWRSFWYLEDNVNNLNQDHIRNDPDDDRNDGGWSRLMGEVKVKF